MGYALAGMTVHGVDIKPQPQPLPAQHRQARPRKGG